MHRVAKYVGSMHYLWWLGLVLGLVLSVLCTTCGGFVFGGRVVAIGYVRLAESRLYGRQRVGVDARVTLALALSWRGGDH